MTNPGMLFSEPSSRKAGKRPLGSSTGVFDLEEGFPVTLDGRSLKADGIFWAAWARETGCGRGFDKRSEQCLEQAPLKRTQTSSCNDDADAWCCGECHAQHLPRPMSTTTTPRDKKRP